jgi:hypothetical protein
MQNIHMQLRGEPVVGFQQGSTPDVSDEAKLGSQMGA